jgi:hypothetical protein
MYYIGLDVHKRMISYCAKDGNGTIHAKARSLPRVVLQAVPKRKDKYLFEGTIWIESHDFAVAMIDGRPAKESSFWVKHVDFVRQYQRVDGFWLPLRDETQVDVKLYGKRVFTIDHDQYAIQDRAERKTEVE